MVLVLWRANDGVIHPSDNTNLAPKSSITAMGALVHSSNR